MIIIVNHKVKATRQKPKDMRRLSLRGSTPGVLQFLTQLRELLSMRFCSSKAKERKGSGDMILNKFLNPSPASSKRDEVCFRASIKVSWMVCIKSRHLLIDYPLLYFIPCLQKGMQLVAQPQTIKYLLSWSEWKTCSNCCWHVNCIQSHVWWTTWLLTKVTKIWAPSSLGSWRSFWEEPALCQAASWMPNALCW